MRANEIKKLLRKQPFRPLLLTLSTGRHIEIRHPEQILATEREFFIGLPYPDTGGNVVTPDSGEAVADDWIVIDPIYVVSAEPVNGQRSKSRKRS